MPISSSFFNIIMHNCLCNYETLLLPVNKVMGLKFKPSLGSWKNVYCLFSVPATLSKSCTVPKGNLS